LLIIGFLLSATIAVLAYHRNHLSETGAIAAIVIGTAVFGFGGWSWGLLLIAFFVSSSALSRVTTARKTIAEKAFAKDGRRDFSQVLANGGIGAGLAIAHSIFPWEGWFAAYLGVMATVTADTWATEIGTLNPRDPRLITDGRQVEAGTSGAISLYGCLAMIAAATMIGLLGSLLVDLVPNWRTISIGLAAGLFGALIDSLLGATLQAQYMCDICGERTEAPRHRCGRKTMQTKGISWLHNDQVNLLASAGGGCAALLLWIVTVPN
jgi:uncharacterized protein (TIGR00297 family)